MAEDFKKFDSPDRYSFPGARLAKDPHVYEGTGDNPLVTLTFVSGSRNEADSDLWVEAKVNDRNADLATFLRKGDILHDVTGKPCLRRYGDSNEKFSFQLRRAEIVVPYALFPELKSRGWVPGAKSTKAAPASNRKPRPAQKTPEPDDDIPF